MRGVMFKKTYAYHVHGPLHKEEEGGCRTSTTAGSLLFYGGDFEMN